MAELSAIGRATIVEVDKSFQSPFSLKVTTQMRIWRSALYEKHLKRKLNLRRVLKSPISKHRTEKHLNGTENYAHSLSER